MKAVSTRDAAELPRAFAGVESPSAAQAVQRRGPVTIYEVAREAGVSIATVSRVQRGTAPVTEATRKRVEAAIQALGYRPSQPARSLAEGHHAASAIVFPDLSGPYYSEVIIGYEQVAAAAERSVLILATHGRERSRQMLLDLASRVDGMVLMGETVDDATIERLDARGMPLVMLARPPLGNADSVRAENEHSARTLATHLLDVHRHRRFAYLGDPGASPDVAERWAAVQRAVAAHPDATLRLVPCPFREAEGHAAAAEVLDGPERPDVLVCTNDEVALGAIAAAQERGLRVPGQLAVTGWDDIGTARFVSPALTTVRQPMRELGARAAEALLERMRGHRSSPRHQVLPTQLVIRASCGSHEREVWSR